MYNDLRKAFTRQQIFAGASEDLFRMRSYVVHAVAAVLIAVFPLAAQTPANPAQTPANSNVRHHRELPKPKNLQVLPKDISPQDLIATMRGYEKALGVECSFCHAPSPQNHHLDFASDANPHKADARVMIRMVNEINPKYLATTDEDAPAQDRRVSCGTCHRGHSHPPPFVPENHQEHSESH